MLKLRWGFLKFNCSLCGRGSTFKLAKLPRRGMLGLASFAFAASNEFQHAKLSKFFTHFKQEIIKCLAAHNAQQIKTKVRVRLRMCVFVYVSVYVCVWRLSSLRKLVRSLWQLFPRHRRKLPVASVLAFHEGVARLHKFSWANLHLLLQCFY